MSADWPTTHSTRYCQVKDKRLTELRSRLIRAHNAEDADAAEKNKR